MKKGILKVLCAVFLLCGLLACSKDDIDTGKLTGVWCLTNVDGAVPTAAEYWSFNGRSNLDIMILDNSGTGGDGVSYIYQLEDDGKTIKVIEPSYGDYSSWAKFKIGKCTQEELTITLKELWIRKDTSIWSGGIGKKYSFRRENGVNTYL